MAVDKLACKLEAKICCKHASDTRWQRTTHNASLGLACSHRNCSGWCLEPATAYERGIILFSFTSTLQIEISLIKDKVQLVSATPLVAK